MKGWKNFSKAISDSQSSIPDKRKGGENYLKGLVNEITDDTAYPGQAKKEDALSSAAAAASSVEERDIEEAVQHSLEEQSAVPVVDTDLRAALDQSTVEAVMQESANLANQPAASVVDTDLRTALEESALEAAMQESANPAAVSSPTTISVSVEPSLHLVLRLRGEPSAGAELSGENSDTESDS